MIPKDPSYYYQPGQGEDHQLSKIQGGAAEQSRPDQEAVVEFGALQGRKGRGQADPGL